MLSPVPRPQMRSPSTTGSNGSVFQPLLLVGGIDVVVAVEQPRELRVLRPRLGVDDRVARGRMHLDREAPALEAAAQEPDLVGDPFAGHAHRGDSHRIEEGLHESVGALAYGGFDHGDVARIGRMAPPLSHRSQVMALARPFAFVTALFLATAVLAQQPYYPDATWEHRAPAEAGFDAAKLKEAIDFALSAESQEAARHGRGPATEFRQARAHGRHRGPDEAAGRHDGHRGAPRLHRRGVGRSRARGHDP